MPTNEAPSTDTHARSLCWSCRQEIDAGPFCKHCVKIQPVEGLGNYFTMFGIEKTFDLNPADLKEKFFELSRKFHPDFYSTKSTQERTVARNNTAHLNTALKVLSDPIHRAEYLLSLVSGSFSSAPTPPQELFEDILEAGQYLDQPTLSENDREALTRAGDNFRTRQQELVDSLDKLFKGLLNGDTDLKGEIESRLNNIKYLRTILNRIDSAPLGKSLNE